MTIAIDAMGGDFAPRNPVRGAIQAVKENDVSVILVGDELAVKHELDQCSGYDPSKVEIVHASQVVEMGESAVHALRSKKDSSMRVAYNLHKQGDVNAVVSAGHSGAMLAIGKFVLKSIKGIERPCISALLPTKDKDGKVLLLDAGANLDCHPELLLEFAILGDVYSEHIHHVDNPRIGLLNIGGEPGKGNEVSKATYELLQNSSLNFIGNIEGKEFFNGHVDVVVTDGFAGNILLKSVQGAASFIKTILKDEIESSFTSKIGALFMSSTFKALKKRTDYAEFGGAPLLGLRGVGVVCHGNSNEAAIQFGVKFAHWASQANMVSRVEEKLHSNQELLQNNSL